MLSFADLIAPITPDQFFAEYFGKKPLHIRGDNAQRREILSWSAFNEALKATRAWTSTSLKLYFNQQEVVSSNYCDAIAGMTGTEYRINPTMLQAFLGSGASLVAARMQEMSSSVLEAAKGLEDAFGADVSANVYCSFEGVQAFGSHYDPHEVFAVQTEGEKLWRIYEGRADTPRTSLPPGEETARYYEANKGALREEVLMRAGDVLYLPHGQYHDALATVGASLHVTFSVEPLDGLNLFSLLETAMRADPQFRAWLPDGRGAGAGILQDRLAVLAERLKSAIMSPRFLEEVVQAQRKSAVSPEPAYELPRLPKPAWFAVTPGRARIACDETGCRLEGAGASYPLGAAWSAAQWVLQQRAFSDEGLKGRFPYLSGDEVDGLLQQLQRFGAIVRSEW